jgi:phosphoglycerate dehydrogenase-like enzyme
MLFSQDGEIMAIRVGINGFGRIGRNVVRAEGNGRQ